VIVGRKCPVVIKTTRFGEISVDDECILSFPRGLYGFEQYTEYCLIDADEKSSFKWLQSTQEASLALVVASPFDFFPDYDIEVDDETIAEMTGGCLEPPLVFCVITVLPQAVSVTMSLQAPILLIASKNIGRQIILNEPRKYKTREPLLLSKGGKF
jgi:flagellar assembly factor FliW